MDDLQRKKLCGQILKGLEDIVCGFRKLSDIENESDNIDISDYRENEDDEKENLQIEIIRSVMVEKARMGKASQIRELLKLFNAEKLSEVHEDYYDELLKLAQNL